MWSLIYIQLMLNSLVCNFLACSWIPSSGVMFASFHSEGTIPSSDKLNNFASGVLICSTISLSSFGGIPSTPGDLLSFIFLIFFAIISLLTNNCPKYSDLLPSNLVNGTGSELISSVVKTEL